MRGNVPVRFGGGRLETYLARGNAPTAYPIEEVTGSSPVAPIKELAREMPPGVSLSARSQTAYGQKSHLYGSGGRLETCLARGNAPTAYPIEEATGSSPVAPICSLCFPHTLTSPARNHTLIINLLQSKTLWATLFRTVAPYCVLARTHIWILSYNANN